MAQGFDGNEPVTGSRTFGTLYAILRTNFNALNSSHSGTSWPANPVGGKPCWRTDYSPRKLFIYNDLTSSWDEVVLASAGLGLELIAARGAHASVDARLDAQINEDGTFKAATSLNPSQWYDLTVASGSGSNVTFTAYGADYTPVYHPTRRVKINNVGGTSYTEVVSSSYGGGNTTVTVRDAVVGVGSAFRNASHSIIAPRKAGAGDGAVSYEMVANRGITSGGGNLNIGDSVVFANGTGTTTLQTVGNYGVGRPIFLVNIHATQSHTFAAYAGQTINGVSSLTVGPNQSVIIFNNGSTWYRLDVPISLVAAVLSGTFTGTYTLGGTPTISSPSITNPTITGTSSIAVPGYTAFGSIGANWTNYTGASFRDAMGVAHVKGYMITGTGPAQTCAVLAHPPAENGYFLTTCYRLSTYYQETALIMTNGEIRTQTLYSGAIYYFDGISYK